MDKSFSKIIKSIMMCSEGQELLLKGNTMIYDGLAMIDYAQEELSKLYPDKSLNDYPEVQISEEYINNMLKMVHFKDQNEGHVAQSSSQNSKITIPEKYLTVHDLKD